jgi:hypothetical protein
MSGARHRRKGDRIERELIALHRELGVHAERYPLSGASRFRGSSHDVDIYVFGEDEAPLVAEVKSRKEGAGFKTLAAGSATSTYSRCVVTMPSRSLCCHGAPGPLCSQRCGDEHHHPPCLWTSALLWDGSMSSESRTIPISKMAELLGYAHDDSGKHFALELAEALHARGIRGS